MGTRSDGDSQAASPNLTPVAQRFIHMRELAWLKTRLEDVMSNATDAILKEARMVASDLSECDFLDDALFSRTATQHDEDAADGKIRHDACEENKCVGGVASAGELGPRREMFILRHVAPFPLAKEYLGAFGMDRNAVSAAAVSHEQLVDFARCHVPRRITCQNSDLTITVTVRPFDPAVTGGRLAESGGPFAQAHRCFMLRFDLQPHDPAARIDVVNSYFLRLDLASSELLEDVGYVHAAHVWRLSQPPFRRRDSNKGSSSSGDNDNDNDNGNGYTESLPRFELSFVNPSDSPMVMKGELYYILRTDNDKTPACELPIRVVSFGHLLLFNGE
ncbi:hypothetical protein DQ04_02721060 [Trypanosoma grayi]|uniref:hypothetical protein n=1 Tax=Trypanosoma grayi TaxID=71804 RepID=UPI0004F45EB3|nr:hypothetical protein DQ04_02721060 [Trypanosoma grayi]KEG11347.1 hypothetical protein DQ04_02721060 [Trypanosoma grayi]